MTATDMAFFAPLPSALHGPRMLYDGLLYLGFTFHIIAVNLVLGSVIIQLFRKVFLRQHKQFLVADPIKTTLPKILAFAINFGVVPLLFLQVRYGAAFYSSSIILAVWWLGLIALLLLSYYGLYIFSADEIYSEARRYFVLGLVLLLLLTIGFIFVNNVTLSQNLQGWLQYGGNAKGIGSNLSDPTLWPRYLHVLFASVAIAGLGMALIANFSIRKLEKNNASPEQLLTQNLYERQGLIFFVVATLLQAVAGLWFLFSLESSVRNIYLGENIFATALFCGGVFFSVVAVVVAFKKNTLLAAGSVLAVVFVMSGMRFLLRQHILDPYYQVSYFPLQLPSFFIFLGSICVVIVTCVWMWRLYAYDRKGKPVFALTSKESVKF